MTLARTKSRFLVIAALAASFSAAAEAHAEYLVICPTAMTATWGGSGGGITQNIQQPTQQLGQLVDSTEVLSCIAPDNVGPLELRVPDDGSCEATVRFSAINAVFGRSEVFLSGVFQARAFVDGDDCVLRFNQRGPLGLDIQMTEACDFNGDEISWTCPDAAVPRFNP